MAVNMTAPVADSMTQRKLRLMASIAIAGRMRRFSLIHSRSMADAKTSKMLKRMCEMKMEMSRMLLTSRLSHPRGMLRQMRAAVLVATTNNSKARRMTTPSMGRAVKNTSGKSSKGNLMRRSRKA